jgi:hypothetical protein
LGRHVFVEYHFNGSYECQTVELLASGWFVFSGFGGRGKDKWKKRKEWKNKWMAMNDDERQDAKARWKAHCEKKKRE